jgi:putative oxidoreductase
MKHMRMKTRSAKIIMWICIALLTLQFLAAGLGKFLGAWSSKFDGWGYPLMFMYIIGLFELTGVAGLYLSITRKWSALLLILIMIGAAYTHISSTEYLRIIHNVIIAGIASLVIQMNKEIEGHIR